MGKNDRIVFYLFDAPYMNGFDLRRVPVEERRPFLVALPARRARLGSNQRIGGPASNRDGLLRVPRAVECPARIATVELLSSAGSCVPDWRHESASELG